MDSAREGVCRVTSPIVVTLEAPAKINLGLEILGRRDDGFHEIRSVMAMLELADSLAFFVDASGHGSGMNLLPRRHNLIATALDAYREAVPNSPRLGWRIEKRIPMAAGLGGASSDAAAALLAANTIAGLPLARSELGQLAARLGSDIAFFLGSPLAKASGTGNVIEPLPAARMEVLLVVPSVEILHKTSTLYSLLQEVDFSNVGQADCVRQLLASNRIPGYRSLHNGFNRPLSTIEPRVLELQQLLISLGAESFGLSGAGPAHYVLSLENQTRDLQNGLAEHLGEWLTFIPTRLRLHSLRATVVNSNE